MSIPTRDDRRINEIGDLHHCILTRLQIYRRGGPDHDPANIREALQDYVSAVTGS